MIVVSVSYTHLEQACGHHFVDSLLVFRQPFGQVLGDEQRMVVGDFGIINRPTVERLSLIHIYDLVGDGELVIDGLPGEHRRPCVKGVDPLTLQLFGKMCIRDRYII